MYKILTTSLALATFTSHALAQGVTTVTATQNVTVTVSGAPHTTPTTTVYTSAFKFVDGYNFFWIFGIFSLATTPDTPGAKETPPAPGSGATPGSRIINIKVGVGALNAYDPNNITAEVGDIVTFTFNPKNHTVTQGSFKDPCISNGGFDTGLWVFFFWVPWSTSF